MDWIYKIQRHASLTSSECRAIALITTIIIVGSTTDLIYTSKKTFQGQHAVHSETIAAKSFSQYPISTDTLKIRKKVGEKSVAHPDSSLKFRSTSKININSAQLSQLIRLKGIGPGLARRIIDYRTLHGPFKSIDELIKVKGIGNGKLSKIREKISTKLPRPN